MGVCLSLSARIKAESPAHTGNYHLLLPLFVYCCMILQENMFVSVCVSSLLLLFPGQNDGTFYLFVFLRKGF